MYLVLKFHGDGEWLGIECLKGLFRKMIVKKLDWEILIWGQFLLLKLFIFSSWGVCSFLRARISGSDFERFFFFFLAIPSTAFQTIQLLSRWNTNSPLNSLQPRNPAASSGVTPRSYSVWNFSIQLESTITLSLSFSSPFLVSHIKKDPKTLKSKT